MPAPDLRVRQPRDSDETGGPDGQGVRSAGVMETRIRDLFAQRVSEGMAPGSAFAVFDRSGILFTGVSGEAAVGGAGPTPDTLFRVASCTKSFTAATILVLRDRGLLDLDAPVSSFVPEYQPETPGPGETATTVRMLLTMSGGLSTDDPWADRQESLANGEFTEVLRRGVRSITEPGTAFAYSNLGYALLGQVIEQVSGLSYPEAVRSLLLDQLGLDVRFERPSDRPVAIGHRRSPGGWVALPFSGPGAFSSIGGVFASVVDLARWAGWLADAWRETDAGDPRDAEAGPLNAASRREMQQLYRRSPPRHAHSGVPSPDGYGFGLFVADDPEFGQIVTHSGGYPGFSAHMAWHAASGIGVVGFENAGYAGAAIPATHAHRLLLRDRFGAVQVVGDGAPPSDAHTAGDADRHVEGGRPGEDDRHTEDDRPEDADRHIDDGQPEDADRHVEDDGNATPWPETLAARSMITGLLAEWNDDVAASVFCTNVELDEPYDERRASIVEAIAAVGGRAETGGAAEMPALTGTDEGIECASPERLSWYIRVRAGRLRVEISLAPVSPFAVQTLRVTAQPLESDADADAGAGD